MAYKIKNAYRVLNLKNNKQRLILNADSRKKSQLYEQEEKGKIKVTKVFANE